MNSRSFLKLTNLIFLPFDKAQGRRKIKLTPPSCLSLVEGATGFQESSGAYRSLCYVALSALLLQAAFLWPRVCVAAVFIFLMPLFYCVVQKRIKKPFLLGLWWGAVFFTFHFWAALIVLFEKAEGPFRLLAGVAFIAYCAFYSGIWFALSAYVARYTKRIEQELICWVLGALLYFYFVANYLFWPCGKLIGYCFGSPLLVLAQYPSMLLSAKTYGSTATLVALLLFQAMVVLCLLCKKYRYGTLALLCILPFGIGALRHSQDEPMPSYLQSLCYAKPPPRLQRKKIDQIEEINTQIAIALRKKPSATCVLMPESSLTHNLDQETIKPWTLNALAQGTTLCIGAYKGGKEKDTNSLFVIEDCRITNCYDKKFLMPFAEYLPSWVKEIAWIRNLFLKKNKEFEQKEECCCPLRLAPNFSCIPKICSDIFLEPPQESLAKIINPEIPILFIVNDAWFSVEYPKTLMTLYAVFYAMTRSRDVLYVSHTNAYWIGHKTGTSVMV